MLCKAISEGERDIEKLYSLLEKEESIETEHLCTALEHLVPSHIEFVIELSSLLKNRTESFEEAYDRFPHLSSHLCVISIVSRKTPPDTTEGEDIIKTLDFSKFGDNAENMRDVFLKAMYDDDGGFIGLRDLALMMYYLEDDEGEGE